MCQCYDGDFKNDLVQRLLIYKLQVFCRFSVSLEFLLLQVEKQMYFLISQVNCSLQANAQVTWKFHCVLNQLFVSVSQVWRKNLREACVYI